MSPTPPIAASSAPAAGPSARPAQQAGGVEAGERGVTVLAPRVVEKIAAQAAGEIEQVFGLPRRLAAHEGGPRQVRADAELDGQIAAVRLQIAAAFPGRLVPLTRQVREHVIARIQTLCGLRVDHVDITVAALRRDGDQRRRVQ